MNDVPIIEITILDITFKLQVFFNMDCCEKMQIYHDQGDDYRSSFAKAVFHMFEQTENENTLTLTREDFTKISDDDLKLILDSILMQDSKVRQEYEKVDGKDVYERFYKALESVFKNATAGIRKSLEIMSKRMEDLNRPLLDSLKSAMSGYNISQNYLSGLNTAKLNMPTYDFSKLKSSFVGFPNASMIEKSTVVKSMQNVAPIFQSALSNALPTGYDVKTVFLPLQNFLESFRNINENYVETLQAPLLQMAESMKSLMSSMDFSMLISRKEWSEQRAILLKYGWLYSSELPDELVNEIYEIYERQGKLPNDDVDKIIIGYFRHNQCAVLKSMVKGWKDLPSFQCRERIFHEALVNHSRKYFNSSVTLLTVHTEGIIIDFVRTNLKNPRDKWYEAVEDIKKEINENEDMSIYEFDVFNDLIEQIEKMFKEKFKCSNPDATSNKSRNKIAHGHVYEVENETNSLKQFLHINEIFHMFTRLNNSE